MLEDAMSESASNESGEVAQQPEAKREISSISFPYGDLEDSIAFAKAVHSVGGQSCELEQVAGYLRVSATTGAFRARLASPRIFGLLEYERNTLTLTDLGLRIVDPAQEIAARVEAFLNVPLYRALYEKYKGYTLPRSAALESEMAKLGVSSKQTDKARQAFDRSAKQAGFYWAGNDRLTLPVVKNAPTTPPVEGPNTGPKPIDPPPSDRQPLHPFIEGLLKTLPETGSAWETKDRIKWLRLAANAFDLIYEGEGEIKISAATQD
jgi:hypothetical protein